MGNRYYGSFEDRFWSKVSVGGQDDCWEWTGAVSGANRSVPRGAFTNRDGKLTPASRVSYEINKGPIPDGLFVLHTCDNGTCVNPNHLYLGTQLDNMRDRKDRGRMGILKGDDDPKSILTSEQVLEIRNMWKGRGKGISQYKIAELYGVSRSTIEAILTRENWKHI